MAGGGGGGRVRERKSEGGEAWDYGIRERWRLKWGSKKMLLLAVDPCKGMGGADRPMEVPGKGRLWP